MQGQVKRISDLSNGEIALWQKLAATRPELRSPFFSLEFAQAVAQSGARARVCVLYRNGDLAGFFPFQFASRFAQTAGAAERIGGELNDFFGVVTTDSQEAAIDWPELLRCARLSLFEATHMDDAQTRLGLAGDRPQSGARITLHDGLDAYWESVKRDHTAAYRNLRNRERKIEREHRSVQFVFADDSPAKLVELVVKEKAKQYARTDVGNALAEPWKVRCLSAIAEHQDGRCLPVVSALYLDGEWAALHFGIRAGNVLHYWFPVYRAELHSFSPGLVLLAKIINHARGNGIAEIDLGEGISRYKELLATEIYQLHRAFWYRPNAASLSYRAFRSLRWRIQRMRCGIKATAAVAIQ